MNADWHKAHPMPTNATVDQRIGWHVAHARNCGCRPIPRPLKVEIKRRRRRRAAPDADQWARLLAGYPTPIQSLAEQLRGLVHQVVPTATERVYLGWRALGFRDPQSGYFCGVFPQHDHVRLLFEHGAALEDPHELLDGDGHQVRWVAIRERRELKRQGLPDLLRAALLHGAVRRKRSQSLRKQ